MTAGDGQRSVLSFEIKSEHKISFGTEILNSFIYGTCAMYILLGGKLGILIVGGRVSYGILQKFALLHCLHNIAKARGIHTKICFLLPDLQFVLYFLVSFFSY